MACRPECFGSSARAGDGYPADRCVGGNPGLWKEEKLSRRNGPRCLSGKRLQDRSGRHGQIVGRATAEKEGQAVFPLAKEGMPGLSLFAGCPKNSRPGAGLRLNLL